MTQAKTLANEGKFDEAIRPPERRCASGIRDDPIVQRIDAEIAAALFAKGADLAALAKPAEALEVFRSIVRDYPDHRVGHAGRAPRAGHDPGHGQSAGEPGGARAGDGACTSR